MQLSIIQDAIQPVWEETIALLVGPAEINSRERIRLQLWDSGKSKKIPCIFCVAHYRIDVTTADDLLGTVEVDLGELIAGGDENGTIRHREDRFIGDDFPGTLEWNFGYFGKTGLHEHLLSTGQDAEKFQEKIEKEAKEKLREALGSREESGELLQQKKEDLKDRTEEIIASNPPCDEWPSGILSIRIQQITELEVEKPGEGEVKETPEGDGGHDPPSIYCTIFLQHQSIYKTRTKVPTGSPYVRH